MRLPAWYRFTLTTALTPSRLLLRISHAWRFLPALFLRNSLLAPSDSLSHASAGTRIGARSLPTHWQIAAVTHAPITANLDQPLNVHVHFAAQITLNLYVAVNILAQAVDLFLRQVLHARIWIHTGMLQHLFAGCQANAINVGQRNLHTLIAWNIDAGNSRATGHQQAPPSQSLDSARTSQSSSPQHL